MCTVSFGEVSIRILETAVVHGCRLYPTFSLRLSFQTRFERQVVSANTTKQVSLHTIEDVSDCSAEKEDVSQILLFPLSAHLEGTSFL